jgi:hypothetical protein
MTCIRPIASLGNRARTSPKLSTCMTARIRRRNAKPLRRFGDDGGDWIGRRGDAVLLTGDRFGMSNADDDQYRRDADPKEGAPRGTGAVASLHSERRAMGPGRRRNGAEVVAA